MEWSEKALTDCLFPAWMNTVRSLAFGCGILLAILAAAAGRVRVPVFFLFSFTLIFADLSGANRIEFTVHPSWLSAESPSAALLKEDRTLHRVAASPGALALYKDPPVYDSVYTGLQLVHEALMPNTLLPKRLFSMSVYDSLLPEDFARINDILYDRLSSGDASMAEILNIKYLFSAQDALPAGFSIIRPSGREGWLSVDANVLSRFRLVSDPIRVSTSLQAYQRMRIDQEDLRRGIIIGEEAGVGLLARPDADRSLEDAVEVTEYGFNRQRLRVRSSLEQWLISSELAYPGWTVRVDGREREALRAYGALRAVRVPKGEHMVEWKYEPILFRIGSGIALLTVTIPVILIVRRRRMSIGL